MQVSELFVAMTRARDSLFLLCDEEPSDVLYEALDYLDEETETCPTGWIRGRSQWRAGRRQGLEKREMMSVTKLRLIEFDEGGVCSRISVWSVTWRAAGNWLSGGAPMSEAI